MSFSSDLQAFWRSFSLERILMAQQTALVIRILDAFVKFPLPLYDGFASTSFSRCPRRHLHT